MRDQDENPYKFPEAFTDAGPVKAPPQTAFFSRRRLIFYAVSLFVIAIVIGMLTPARRGVSEPARSVNCQNRMRELGIALANYAAEHGQLPPAYTRDELGKPLHSWRVLILPYIEEDELHRSIDLSKPWDHPDNAKARESTPRAFVCRSSQCPPGHTTYLANAGAQGVLVPGNGNSLPANRGGAKKRIILFEVANEQSVEWMSPQDGDHHTLLRTLALPRQQHGKTLNIVFDDGSAKSMSREELGSDDVIQSLFTGEGEEQSR